MSDVTQLTGSPVMWLFSGLIVAAAIFQSVVLYRLAWGLSALLPLIIFLALSWGQASKSAAHAVSLLAAAAAMLALNLAAGRLGKTWLKEWAMALSVLCGILAGALTAAQTAVGARMGTRRSEFAGVAGIVASVAVNFAVLIGVVLFGNFILSVLPAAVVDALAYALPSVYGSLLVVFIARLKR